jgi:hypothetical protein
MNCICGKPCNEEIGSCEKHFEVDPDGFQGRLLKAGLSPMEFSDITGTPLPTVYSWVNGGRPPGPLALWAVVELAKKTSRKKKKVYT